MSYNEITKIIQDWQDVTGIVVSLKELPVKKVEKLLKETYFVMNTFHKDELIPKELGELFLEIEEFLYFSSIMEENEMPTDYYRWQKIFTIVKSLEKGFFQGEYELPYPRLKMKDISGCELIIDFESNFLENLIIPIK